MDEEMKIKTRHILEAMIVFGLVIAAVYLVTR